MKTIQSKTLVSLLLIALVIGSNGCLTQSTIKYAEGNPTYAWIGAPSGDVAPDNTPKPAYYALLPLTIPADIVTAPIQVVGYGCLIGLACMGFFPPVSH